MSREASKVHLINKPMSNDNSGTMREMPKYECYKIVHALKILKIEVDHADVLVRLKEILK